MTAIDWSGRRVFVTGHTGFKGSWLCATLRYLGAEVTGYALAPPSTPNGFDLCQIAGDLVTDHRADILDLDQLQRAMAEAAPEVVIHLAAQTLVGVGVREPLRTFTTNVTGSSHVLEAVRSTPPVRAVVMVTSDKCYENLEWVHPYRETDRLGGLDPYSSSKACAELVTQAYRTLIESQPGSPIAVATARAGNVIGGGDWAEGRLVPDCIRAFTKGVEVRLRYPDAVRPWQHVMEPVSGYIRLAERLLSADAAAFASAWNFGPDAGGEATVQQVATQIAGIWGPSAQVVADPSGAAHKEARLLRLDSTKARVQLGWFPRWSGEEALRQTIAWYQNWHDGGDCRAFTLSQIAAFLAGPQV